MKDISTGKSVSVNSRLWAYCKAKGAKTRWRNMENNNSILRTMMNTTLRTRAREQATKRGRTVRATKTD